MLLEPNQEEEKYTQNQLIGFLNDGHKKNHHCFVLIYLVGCGPCNMTKPEWKKAAEDFDYRDQNKGIVMAHIDQNNLDRIRDVVGSYSVSGFPTMLHVHKNKISSYEDSNVKNKNRTAESFREWINNYVNMTGVGNTKRESKMEELHRPLLSMSISSSSKSKKQSHSRSQNQSRSSSSKHSKKHRQTGGKWSLKYKRSINCKRPKGFSQRQHCKYGRKSSRRSSYRRK
jgi:hypothetical protein